MVFFEDLDELIDVPFLVDPGSEMTVLHPVDTLKSKLWDHPHRFRTSATGIRGIGGTHHPSVREGTIILTHLDGQRTYFDVDLYIPRLSEETRGLPSILGGDVLSRGSLQVDYIHGSGAFDVAPGELFILR